MCEKDIGRERERARERVREREGDKGSPPISPGRSGDFSQPQARAPLAWPVRPQLVYHVPEKEREGESARESEREGERERERERGRERARERAKGQRDNVVKTCSTDM